MKKKGYKHNRKRIYRLIRELMIQREARMTAETQAEYYKDRFQRMGSNVETVDPEPGCPVKVEKWEVRPRAWGTFLIMNPSEHPDLAIKFAKESLVREIARSLIENDLVQFIVHEFEDDDDPLNDGRGTVGAKLYIVPWEQMPFSRRIQIAMKAEKIIEEEPK